MLNILDSGNTEQYLFLATAIPPEMTFAQKYPTGTALPTQAFLRYMKQLTAVLQYVHDQQVVHGHLSPEYIFFKQDDTLILSGFDEAIKTIVDADYDPPFHFEYMAPERFQGKALAASDQYALGVLAYEWLCGELPFKQTGNNISSLLMQHMQVTPPSLRAKNPALAPAIEDVVMQALAKDPAQRFASIQAFAKALEQAFQPPAFRPHEMLNQQFGAYRLVSYLGSGNLGYVYLAEHISLNSKVVVKILKEPMDTGYFRSRIRRIARLSHPNIVRVIDSGIHNDLPFLIMDYAPHGTLRERHAQQQLPLALVVEYVQQIAAALQEAHDQNMLMEGIRPEHILLGHNNELLVSGFEVIFRERTTPDETHTAQYTAPEQQAGTHLAASDQYALGIMVYEWLSGRQLSQVETLSNTSLPSLDTLVPELPPKVNEVVMQALAKDPKQRFTGVEDFANALEEASTLQSKSNTSSYVGQEFGRYRIVKLLGRGGFADVYVGKHVDMQTFAAIKILDVRMVHEHAQNFLKEARIIAGLNHPNIVRVLDFGIKSDLPFLVMDQAKQALRDIHPKGSVLTPSSILPYLKQVASALHYAHNQRVLHRDVKPENILLGFRNQVLLSDFGLATLMGQSNVHHTQRIVGTAKYMAPEQFKMEVSPASDQYSLGIVVYEWLTSEPPFTEGGFAQLMYQHLELAPPSIREKVPTLSPDIERVVMIALAKDPKQRFGSILAFANAFEQACR